jgi:hypothetical protein
MPTTKTAESAYTLSRKEEVPARAAAGQRECQTGKNHASEVPEGIGMRYRLSLESGLELSQHQIGQKRKDNQRQYAV